MFLIISRLDFRSFKIRKMQRYPLDFLSPAINSIGMLQFLLFISAFVCRLPLFLFYSIIFTLCTFALFLQKHLCLKNLKNVSIWRNQITFTVIFSLKFLFILALMVIFIVHSSLCVFKSSFLCYIFGQFNKIVTIVFYFHLGIYFMGRVGGGRTAVIPMCQGTEVRGQIAGNGPFHLHHGFYRYN